MGNFTHEFGNRSTPLEKYEWDNVWWDSTDDSDTPRVLYIGDSISCGTRHVATRASEGSLLFDGLGTSKAVDNPYFAETVRIFAKQQGSRAAVLFNNGLHGYHLDVASYREHYEKMIQFLLREFEGTPILLVLTTAVCDEEENELVIARNKAVSELAAQYKLPIVDLYTVVDQHRDLISPDGVHLLADGYELLAKELVRAVQGAVSKSSKGNP